MNNNTTHLMLDSRYGSVLASRKVSPKAFKYI